MCRLQLISSRVTPNSRFSTYGKFPSSEALQGKFPSNDFFRVNRFLKISGNHMNIKHGVTSEELSDLCMRNQNQRPKRKKTSKLKKFQHTWKPKLEGTYHTYSIFWKVRTFFNVPYFRVRKQYKNTLTTSLLIIRMFNVHSFQQRLKAVNCNLSKQSQPSCCNAIL